MEKFPELKEKLRVVIFVGGYGTRMWPMSRRSLPKQFQPLLGESSFFEDTLARVKLAFKPEDIFVAAPREQINLVQEQAKGVPFKNFIIEPERRDTLGAVAFSTAYLEKHFPNSLMAIIWSDHIVKKKEEFNHLLMLAARVCQEKKAICKVDVRPSYPSSAQGWMKIGREVGRVDGHPVYEFLKHIEKPKLEQAKKMFLNRNYLVNTGYFVFRTSTMLTLLQKYSPDCYKHIAIIIQAFGSDNEKKIIQKEYHQINKISFDYAISEKLSAGSQLEIIGDMGFYDIGTWDLLYEALAVGQKENVCKGEAEFIESKGNLVYLPKTKIAAIIGLDNLVVVDTQDGLLVCRRGRGADIKKFIEILKKKKLEQYL